MKEKDLINMIDYKFPYNNFLKGKKMVDVALKISSNSIFCIIEELIRVPKSIYGKVDKNFQLQMLEYININFNHYLKNDILDISYRFINGKKINENEVIKIMNKIIHYNGLYCTLNIMYFLIDDVNGTIEKKYNEIIKIWG